MLRGLDEVPEMGALLLPARHRLILNSVARPTCVEGPTIAAAEGVAEATGIRTGAEEGRHLTTAAIATLAVVHRKGAGHGSERTAIETTDFPRQMFGATPVTNAIDRTANCSAPKWKLAQLRRRSRLVRAETYRRLL